MCYVIYLHLGSADASVNALSAVAGKHQLISTKNLQGTGFPPRSQDGRNFHSIFLAMP